MKLILNTPNFEFPQKGKTMKEMKSENKERRPSGMQKNAHQNIYSTQVEELANDSTKNNYKTKVSTLGYREHQWTCKSEKKKFSEVDILPSTKQTYLAPCQVLRGASAKEGSNKLFNKN